MVSPTTSPAQAPADAQMQNVLSELGGDPKPGKDTEIDIDTVQKRLEDLLSKSSLEKDTFIQQHMNAQMYIPLSILLRHQTLQILGDEANVLPFVKDAAQRSDKVGLDEEGLMIRPLLKPRRNTLILHDLPENFPEDELKALFAGSPEGDNFTSLKPDVNNTAFASFTTDEAAQNAALWLRSQQFQGNEIKCAVKSEHFVRSFFPADHSVGSPWMMPHSAPWGYGGGPWMPAHGGWGGSSSEGWGDAGTAGWMNDVGSPGSNYSRDAKGKGKDKGKGKGKGRQRGSLGGSFSQDSQMETNSDFSHSSPQMGPGHMGDGGQFQEGLAEPGYTHEYRKYSRQYIIEACNAMDDIIKPESFAKCEKNDVALFRSTPCKDWAPLPTPMATFAANFFDNDRRGSDAQEGDGKSGERAPRKASWGPRGSRAESHDYEGEGWTRGDQTWWKPSAQDAKNDKRRSNSKSWGDGKSWEGYGEQKQWVKKEDKAKAEQEADGDDSGAPRKMSWAEKVKGAGESAERPQKWVAKKTGDEGKSKDEAAQGDSATAAPAEAPATATAGDAAGDAASPSGPLSWADKARQAAGK